MITLEQVFEEQIPNFKFDLQIAKEIYKFQTSFVTKNDEHLAFFGGHLTGVQRVVFSPSDFNNWFNICDVDAIDLQAKLYEADAVNPKFKVSSNVFNLLNMWLIHKCLTSPYLNPKQKERTCLDIALVYNYACLTSLLNRYFQYPADPKIAEAAYNRLSYKFMLKKLGNWQEVMLYRAEDLAKPAGLHYETLKIFKNDLRVTEAVADSQGRVRDLLKNIYAEFLKAHKAGDKIRVTSSTENNMEGDEVLADKTHGLESYIDYALTVINDPASFIKQELIDIILNVLPTLNINKFSYVLNYITGDLNPTEHRKVIDLVRLTLVHSFTYLTEHSNLGTHTKDLSRLLSGLKNAYTSSRNADIEIEEMRANGELLVRESLDTRTSEQQISALRTGLFLYINLRTYTKHHYGSH